MPCRTLCCTLQSMAHTNHKFPICTTQNVPEIETSLPVNDYGLYTSVL